MKVGEELQLWSAELLYGSLSPADGNPAHGVTNLKRLVGELTIHR